jgi:hypothetical protein
MGFTDKAVKEGEAQLSVPAPRGRSSGAGGEDTMATEVYLFIGVLAIGIVYVTKRVWERMRFRGKMLVTCPETREPAAVKVNVRRAVVKAMAGRKELELSECSRWPERGECDQYCLEQIERDPENHRVWTIAAHWYVGKKCAYCQRPIEALSHFDRRPALLDRQRKTAEWDDVPAEKLPGAFSTDLPVCWSCHMAHTFVREHPDLVVYRPWEKCGPLGEYVPKNLNPKTENVSARM